MTTQTQQETEMASQEVAFDDVADAAERLQDDGKKVTIEAVSEILGSGSVTEIHKHLSTWRTSNAKPFELPKVEMPDSLMSALSDWVQRYAEESGAGSRQALAQAELDLEALAKSGEQLEAERDELRSQIADLNSALDERIEQIERLTAELRNARQIASDALVSKAKDQLAIDGKDNQLAELRAQLERNVAASAAESDRRLAAEMELVGAITARDNFEAEAKELRAQLDSCYNDRRKAAGVKA
jgi:chromosome segregation ATPase